MRVNTGFLFRQHRQARLDRVQAIDIVQPLLARIFGLAELKFEVADAGESAVRLAYLPLDAAPAAPRHHPGPRRRGGARSRAMPRSAAPRGPGTAGAGRAAAAPRRAALLSERTRRSLAILAGDRRRAAVRLD